MSDSASRARLRRGSTWHGPSHQVGAARLGVPRPQPEHSPPRPQVPPPDSATPDPSQKDARARPQVYGPKADHMRTRTSGPQHQAGRFTAQPPRVTAQTRGVDAGGRAGGCLRKAPATLKIHPPRGWLYRLGKHWGRTVPRRPAGNRCWYVGVIKVCRLRGFGVGPDEVEAMLQSWWLSAQFRCE